MKYSVLYACNEAYSPFAGVSIHSLLSSNRDAEEIDIYLVTDEVSEKTLKKLQSEVGSFGAGRRLLVVDAAPYIREMQAGIIPMYRGSYTTNLRLFFEKFIQPDCERLLYLDCDIVLAGSLAGLFSANLGEAPAAVVQESIAGVYPYEIGFSAGDPYFNAGVFFIHVPNWKKQHCTERLFEMMNDPRHRYMNPDQDLLNILLKNRVHWLLPQYNLQPAHLAYSDRAYFRRYGKKCYYSKEEIDFSRKNPVIYHTYRFCGQFPWHKNSVHPAREIWLKNKAESVFADHPPVPNKGAIFVVERALYRLLPRSVFLWIFSLAQRQQFRAAEKRMQKELRAKEKQG